ncbi:MAG: peptide ABC transporter substrate-binding protein [Methylotenera sp. 24-45-7]|jgi:peptide/nickel transport system substrate-binding protein|nr:MAG: peptide ABC transporter substrate-binding protein [Mehylophilales bacterium 35-46-6]OYZ40920.1 MAG: peptide ABC transporter substrate-binding protein [Methylotenera sp. 24-45-7]OZA08089.1 MAG: peptide ABC transporter substrate-binding protein [Methylotenera sp. 17-45-7]OZA54124.1 MAG: peptide ABC transporter substrate-binding protein [Methylophilales bacterium 39-45-7]HQS36867.1 ABC transporter substrate-binding protein [Methylotenera sp.]
MRVLIIMLSLLFLSACPQSEVSQVESVKPIRFALAQMPLNLDPRYATDAASERVNRLLYQSLVDFDTHAKPVSSLATWQMLNPLHYQFILKQPLAEFQSRQTLNAEDVKATYDSLLSLKDAPQAAEFTNIASIKVMNPYVLEFRLKQPDPHFVSKLIIGILPKRLIQQQHDFAHQPVGSGAFSFVRWDKQLVLSRKRDAQPVIFTEVKDPIVRVLKLIRGEVDLLQGDLPPELVKYLQQQTEISVQTVQGTNFSYLGLNMQDPLLKQIKVRQALAYSIDRAAIIEKVMVKDTRAASSILAPEHYTNRSALLSAYEYQPELAKRLLIEAGVNLPLKLVYKTSTDAQRVRLATIMQSQMAKAGIDLEIRSLDWGTFFEEIKKGNFQLYGLTWVGIKTPEIYTKAFGSQFTPPKGFNRGHYTDTQLDALLANEDWPAATKRIHQQLPYIPLWYEGQFAAFHQNIRHYSPKPDGNWDDLATITRSATINTYAH